MSWHVVNTLSHQETRAETNLRRQGFRAWLPTIRRTRRHARRIETVTAPLFPGYLFVELDLERDIWSPINGTLGVRRLLMAESTRPATAPDDFVAALQDSIAADGSVAVPAPPLQPGQTVRLIEGPFADCLASVLRMSPGDRITLLLDILGRTVTTTTKLRSVAIA